MTEPELRTEENTRPAAKSKSIPAQGSRGANCKVIFMEDTKTKFLILVVAGIIAVALLITAVSIG